MKMMSPRKAARILVVDDVPENRILLERYLAAKGYEVTSAQSGGEALNLIPAEQTLSEVGDPFDAVILDIVMPEIDGITVLREYRKAWSPIEMPVIMVTARNQSDDMIEALTLGASDYVTKPIDLPVLLARLATQIDLKRSHKALREAQQSLIQAARMESVGVLAAGVAHEIRNPFAQILMACEGMARLDCLQSDETGSLLVEMMSGAVGDADRIVKRLMEFSHSHRLPLENGDVNLLIRETVELLHEELPDGIEFELQLSPELKQARIAPVKLQQVLINLLINSVQAMAETGTISIATSSRFLSGLPANEGSRSAKGLRNGAEACIIEIEDTGHGIPPQSLELIYDAFFTTRATGSGSGLGLTIARKVIDLHEGILEVKNRTDRTGARVQISLPIAESAIGESIRQMV